MSALLDDDLKKHEDSAANPESVTPMTPEEQDFFTPHEKAMVQNDPNKRVQKNGDDASQAGEQKEKADDNGIPLNEGIDAFKVALAASELSLTGKALKIGAQLFGAAGRNKGKVTGTISTVVLIIVVSIFGSSLALVSAKNNAEKKFGSITDSVLDKQFGEIMTSSRNRFATGIFKDLRLEKSINLLDQSMAQAGYEVLPDGSGLRLPADENGVRNVITSTTEFEAETKAVAKKSLPGLSLKNIRARNKASKEFAKRLGIARSAAIDAANKVAQEGSTSTPDEAATAADDAAEKQVKENARSEAFKGDGEADFPDAKQAATDGSTAGGSNLDEADDLATQLEQDGAKDVIENSEGRLSTAVAANVTEEALEPIAAGVSKSLLASGTGLLKGNLTDVIQMTCRIAQFSRGVYVAGLINKKVNLIKVFSVFVNNADAIVTGKVNSKLLNAFMKTVQTNGKTGQSWTSSAGMRSMMGDVTAQPTDGQNSYFRTDRQDAGGFLKFLIGIAGVKFLGYNACSAVNSGIGTVVGSVLEWSLPVIAGVLTAPAGGAGAGATIATEEAATLAVEEAAGKVTGKVIGEAVAKALGKGAATEVGAQLGETWLKSYVGTIFSSTMVTFSKGEAGPFMGDAFSAGAGAFFEQSGRNAGMRPLDRLAYIDAMKDVRSEQRTQLAQKSLYERFLSVGYQNTDSLASTALANSPLNSTSPSGVVNNLMVALTNANPLGQVQRFASTAISGSAYAQDGQVETDSNGYVTDVWGNYIVGNNFSDINSDSNYTSLQESGQVNDAGDPVSGSDLQKYIDECTQVDIREYDATNAVKNICVNSQARSYQSYLAFRNNADSMNTAFSAGGAYDNAQ